MAKYLGHRIASIVWVDSDITITTLIEVIHDLTTYQLRYGKAWRVSYPSPRKWDRSLYMCAHDVQFTRIVTI
jgi:hypothetical protein